MERREKGKLAYKGHVYIYQQFGRRPKLKKEEPDFGDGAEAPEIIEVHIEEDDSGESLAQALLTLYSLGLRPTRARSHEGILDVYVAPGASTILLDALNLNECLGEFSSFTVHEDEDPEE